MHEAGDASLALRGSCVVNNLVKSLAVTGVRLDVAGAASPFPPTLPRPTTCVGYKPTRRSRAASFPALAALTSVSS